MQPKNKNDKPDLRSLRTAETFEKREHWPFACPGGKRARTWPVELSWCREEIGREHSHLSTQSLAPLSLSRFLSLSPSLTHTLWPPHPLHLV